mmetsp:Transcript_77294/g.128898  ORF Transcript_77294/g.128898 Transcript_77294/m.128898 type:complete len:266 (+) Transcript_77294:1604-2401(+)
MAFMYRRMNSMVRNHHASTRGETPLRRRVRFYEPTGLQLFPRSSVATLIFLRNTCGHSRSRSGREHYTTLADDDDVALVIDIHLNAVSLQNVSAQHTIRQCILKHGVDGSSQWSCTIQRVPTMLQQLVFELLRYGHSNALGCHTPIHILQHDISNPANLWFGELLEHHNLIDAVQEFRLERHFHGFLHLTLEGLIRLLFLRLLTDREAKFASASGNDLTPHVGRHDHHRVLEIHSAPLRISQATVFQNLQHHVEYVRMGLLDLIE